MSKPRWLWISAEVSPEPATGLLVYSARLSGAVAEFVDITMVGIGPSMQRTEVDVRPVEGALRGGWRSLLSSLPNLSYASQTPAMARAVTSLIAEGNWDAVVIDHLQVAWACELLNDHRIPVIFITHNHEASMRRQVAGETPIWAPRGLPLRLDAVKAARLERLALARASIVTSITETDQQKFINDAPSATHVLIKPGWAGEIPDSVTPLAERPRRVGIIGSFEWHVKQENLMRFATEAGPVLAAADIELAVAGKVPEALANRLADECPSVRCIGWVDSVAEFLGQCRVGVVAEPLGGGFKLKSLDYVALRVPIAATAGSLEGLPLAKNQSMIEADSERALGHEIADRIDNTAELEKLASAALSACAPTLQWKPQVRALMEAFALVG